MSEIAPQFACLIDLRLRGDGTMLLRVHPKRTVR